MHLIGIRREDINPFERRCPLTPSDVGRLRQEYNVQTVVQPSPRRIFPDRAYKDEGAAVAESLHACPVIVGIKEVLQATMMACKTYAFFSHTIKGQAHNMPMLRRLMALGCSLMDYEKITDDAGRRLIFFGPHAGLAGAIDSLWALGQRLQLEGLSTPLASVQPAHTYRSLRQAVTLIREVGLQLRRTALPPDLSPLVVGVTGYGNVSAGAQQILDALGAAEAMPEQLLRGDLPTAPLIKVVFHERHLVQGPADRDFELQRYYAHPEEFTPCFDRYLPELNVLLNCIYCEERIPTLVLIRELKELYHGAAPRLRVIGDISCDLRGSIEATVCSTSSAEPVFVYDLDSDRPRFGVEGRGPVILAVPNLPAELPREASAAFSAAILPFIPALVSADWSGAFASCGLPAPLRRAVILYRGELTPDYQYLNAHLRAAAE